MQHDCVPGSPETSESAFDFSPPRQKKHADSSGQDCASTTTTGSPESAFSLVQPQQKKQTYSLGVVELQHDYMELNAQFADLEKSNKALQWESAEKQRRIESLTLKTADQQVAVDNLKRDIDRARQIGLLIEQDRQVNECLKLKVDAAYSKERLATKSLQDANGKLQLELEDLVAKSTALEETVEKLTWEEAQAAKEIDGQRSAIQTFEAQEQQRSGLRSEVQGLTARRAGLRQLVDQLTRADAQRLEESGRQQREQEEITQLQADLEVITEISETLREENEALRLESMENRSWLGDAAAEVAESQQQVLQLQKQRNALLERVGELISRSAVQQEANEALEREKEEMLESIAAFGVERREVQQGLRETQQVVRDLSARQVEQQRTFEELARKKAEVLEEKGELAVRVTYLEERSKCFEQLDAERWRLQAWMDETRKQRQAATEVGKAEQLQQVIQLEEETLSLKRELHKARRGLSGAGERERPPATTPSWMNPWACLSSCPGSEASPEIVVDVRRVGGGATCVSSVSSWESGSGL